MIARLNLGGPAHQAALLSGRRLDPDRYETLLIYGRVARGEESMADLAEREGARAVYLPSLAQPVDPVDDLASLRRIRAIARAFRPHIVHTHTAKAGFLGRAAAMTLRPRPVLIHTFHGHVLEGYFGPLKSAVYRALERALARRTDVLIGVSEATVADLVRLRVAPPERFRVIALGLDLQPFVRVERSSGQAFRREIGIESDAVLLSYVGRIVPIKRLDVLLRAFRQAVEHAPRLRLAIVGDGDPRADLERLAAELGVSRAVHFLGYRRDTARIAAAADIAVLSSDNEGTPVSLIEAGAARVPAVATAVGGVPAVVTPATGVLVPARHAQAFADAIVALAADDNARERMGQRVQEHALASFSVERLIGDVDSLYRECLDPGRGTT